jgi:hypothetical protein
MSDLVSKLRPMAKNKSLKEKKNERERERRKKQYMTKKLSKRWNHATQNLPNS